jgi:hypothetical protein
MAKRLKIFLTILALISVGLSASIIFDWNFYSFSNIFKKNKQERSLFTQETVDLSAQEEAGKNITELNPKKFDEMNEEEKISLILPVEKKYLENAKEDEYNLQILSFYLNEGTPIRSMFNGRVIRATSYNNPFAEDELIDGLVIQKENSQIFAVYLIVGEVLVEGNDIIEQGAEIAKAKDGFQGFHNGANLTLAVYDEENRYIDMKSFFQNK